LEASFDKREVAKTVSLEPAEEYWLTCLFGVHTIEKWHTRVWWPNGYGKPELYTLKLAVTVDGKKS